MKKRILFLILLAGCLCFHVQYGSASPLISSAGIWRDNIVYETGVFTGVQDSDNTKASTILVGVANPDDYLVHLTSGDLGFVDGYLAGYRDLGGGNYEFVKGFSLPPPGSAWENDTYGFQIVDSATQSIDYGSTVVLGIPDGYVSNPLDIPEWYAFSGELLNPTVEWGATLQPDEGLYGLRVYELNPDGSFNYQAINYSTPLFAATTWNLDGFTMEYGKSYAIGIQSIIMNPYSGGTINRSQYYVRYDTAPVPEPTTILLLGCGLLALAGLRGKLCKS